MNFRERTFLEAISLSAREPVYSAAFAWLLGNGSPLALSERLAILQACCHAPFDEVEGIEAETEWKNVDLLLTLRGPKGKRFVAIENKIKALEGIKQLERYDKCLSELVGPVHKIFLTLSGDLPASGVGWQPVSYAQLNQALASQANAHHPYVSELRESLARLIAVKNAANSDPEIAAAAFDKLSPSDADMWSYIKDMRLEMIVQRSWMACLLARLEVAEPWSASIEETNGQALLNVFTTAFTAQDYIVGLQLQYRSLKLFCRPEPYPKSASDQQNKRVEEVLMALRPTLGVREGVMPSAQRGRGFRSFTMSDMPKGRSIEEWAVVMIPHMTRLQKQLAMGPNVS